MPQKIFTIGYQGTTVDDLIAALKEAGVARVIDVRAVPLSRKRGFSKRALAGELAESGIEYVHLQALGTPKEGRDAARAGDCEHLERVFRGYVEAYPEPKLALKEAASLIREKPSALLCFEATPETCHRTIVADILRQEMEADIIALSPPQAPSRPRKAAKRPPT